MYVLVQISTLKIDSFTRFPVSTLLLVASIQTKLLVVVCSSRDVCDIYSDFNLFALRLKYIYFYIFVKRIAPSL